MTGQTRPTLEAASADEFRFIVLAYGVAEPAERALVAAIMVTTLMPAVDRNR